MQRNQDRNLNQLREVTIEPNVNIHAEGSVLISFGNTKVICNASIENNVPRWMKNSDEGWVTGEYGMLPRSTNERMRREASKGKQSGRTLEIQRLIGRSLRQAVNLKYLKGKTINVDCDVIQADGGTRTASISGAFIALKHSVNFLMESNEIKKDPIREYLGAVSCGIYRGKPILDLDYKEDSEAEADANFVITEKNKIIEIQATAEQYPFSEKMFSELMDLAKSGIEEIIKKQKDVLEN